MSEYSRWRPSTGGYDYFQDATVLNLNDDLPVPVLPPGTKLGVPSIEAGRMPKGTDQAIGSGEVAVGLLMPLDPAVLVKRNRSLGTDKNWFGSDTGRVPPIAYAALGLFAGYYAYKYATKRRRAA
jgi:hypothetical protein